MSAMRFDPTTSDWVIFAPSRSLRPHDGFQRTARTEPAEGVANCPFCPGNEAFTPPEIYSVRDPANPSRWKVRVFPNKFPALRIEDNPSREADGEIFQHMGGCGAHEVIVESPDHHLLLAQQPLDQVERLLGTLQARYQDLMQDRRFQTVILFKNHGLEAGTSLAHPHWQLIATPVVPRLLRVKHFEASEYFDRTGSCLYAVIREQELASGKRILACNDDYVAFLPFASHMPFESWIVPRNPPGSFSQVRRERLRTLADMLKRVLLKLHTALDNPAFNLTIDDVPRGDEVLLVAYPHPASADHAGRIRTGERDGDQYRLAGGCGRLPQRGGGCWEQQNKEPGGRVTKRISAACRFGCTVSGTSLDHIGMRRFAS